MHKPNKLKKLLIGALILGLAPVVSEVLADKQPKPAYSPGPMLKRFLDGPMAGVDEINVDGSGLVQLTGGPDDDIEPIYCPDGSIVFGSARCRRFVNCWFTRVAALYRCDGDGKRFDMPGFRPNEHYIREMRRFGFLPKDLKPDDPIDVYAVDRLYWESFNYPSESTYTAVPTGR